MIILLREVKFQKIRGKIMKLLVIDVQVGISDERIYQYSTFIQNLQ